MKEKIKKLVGAANWNKLNRLKEDWLSGFKQESYAQEGEDLILSRYFAGKKNGFYVDVGAHHPMRFSNTFLFYRKGWRGINIDAMPGSMLPFNQKRSRDINLEIAVSAEPSELRFSIFSDPALNGFVDDAWIEKVKKNGYELITQKNINTLTLEQILDNNLPPSQTIDFMSIDVEGLDFEVFKSNNWKKYRPEILIMENENQDMENALKSELFTRINNEGYSFFAKTINSWFFKRN